jgi:hypothetical protein
MPLPDDGNRETVSEMLHFSKLTLPSTEKMSQSAWQLELLSDYFIPFRPSGYANAQTAVHGPAAASDLHSDGSRGN